MEQSFTQENIPQTQLEAEAPRMNALILNTSLENQPAEQPIDIVDPATEADSEPQIESSAQEKPKKSLFSRILGRKKDKDKHEDSEKVEQSEPASNEPIQDSEPFKEEIPEATKEQNPEGLMKRLSSVFQRKKSEKPVETEPEAVEPVIEKLESFQIPEPETVIEPKDEPEATEEMEKVQEQPKLSFGKLKSIFAKSPEETATEAETFKEQNISENVLEEPIKETLQTETVSEAQVKEAQVVEEKKSSLVKLKSLFTKTPEDEDEAAAESSVKEIQASFVEEPQEILPESKVQESTSLEQLQNAKVISETLSTEPENPVIEKEPKVETVISIEELKPIEPESKPEVSIVPEQEQPQVSESVVPVSPKEQETAPESVPSSEASREIPSKAVAEAIGTTGVVAAVSGQSEETKTSDQDTVLNERMKRAGTLYKRGKYCHCNWKKRFFALAVDGEINYFHTSYCTRIHGTLHVDEHTKVEDLIEDNHDVVYELKKDQFIYPFDVVFQDQTSRFAATSIQEKLSWIQAIRETSSAASAQMEEISHEHTDKQCSECSQTLQ